jgi:hypothetical protein
MSQKIPSVSLGADRYIAHPETIKESAVVGAWIETKDPRDDKNKKHHLMDILFLVIAAVISGAEGWEAIEAFGQEKLRWLRNYFPFTNGVPSHDCIENSAQLGAGHDLPRRRQPAS